MGEFEQRAHVFQLLAGEIADLGRQARADDAERVARAQDCGELAHLVDRVRGADLAGNALQCLLIPLDAGETLAQSLLGQILKCAGNLICAALLVRRQEELDLVAVAPRFAQHQVAADPFPDGIERGARDAAEMLALRHVVDNERLDGDEEQPLRIADARKLATLPARRFAQLLQDRGCAGRRLTAQQRAFQLGSQESTRFWLQLKQILAQFAVGRRVRHARNLKTDQRLELAAGR